jgi:anti-sigma factor ChrR (cupin superfamily)
MKQAMDIERLKELAALDAVGALDGDDANEFQDLVSNCRALRKETAAFNTVAASLARSLPAAQTPPAELKTKILQGARGAVDRRNQLDLLREMLPPAPDGLSFIRAAGQSGWLPLPVPGATVKLLSLDSARGYAVVLGRLEPGTRYPAHQHLHGEEIYILSGDLNIGDEKLCAGDFHRAEAGTAHAINYSEQGCTILAVLSTEDLLAQFAPKS